MTAPFWSATVPANETSSRSCARAARAKRQSATAKESLKVRVRGRMSLSLSAARARGVERTRRHARSCRRGRLAAAREKKYESPRVGTRALCCSFERDAPWRGEACAICPLVVWRARNVSPRRPARKSYFERMKSKQKHDREEGIRQRRKGKVKA